MKPRRPRIEVRPSPVAMTGVLSENAAFICTARKLKDLGYTWSAVGRAIRLHFSGRVVYELCSPDRIDWFYKTVLLNRERAAQLTIGAEYLIEGRGYRGELIGLAELSAKVRLPGGQVVETFPEHLL